MRTIPPAPPVYNPQYQHTLSAILREELQEKVSKVQPISQLLLQSPNGSVYALTVDDAGVLATTAVFTP